MPINDTIHYVNQYHDVRDLPETPQVEGTRTCNVSCVAMITGEDVNSVLEKIGLAGDRFQWEETLVAYLRKAGRVCAAVGKPAYPNKRQPDDADLKAYRDAIDTGAVVLYHKYGHYQLLVGYEYTGSAYTYIFNDPAGDRRQPQYKRIRDSGHLVPYSEDMVKAEHLYGQCWAVS